MSYCVNCGVELDRSLKKCPLCGVEVHNPREKEPVPEETMFPESRDELKKKDRAFWIGFFALLSLVPIATCTLCNLLYDKQLSWSIFVTAGVLMVWVFSTSPFYFGKFDYRKIMLVDFMAILFGLLIIELADSGKGWLLIIALPTLVYCLISIMVIVELTRKKKILGLGIAAAITLSVIPLVLILETLIDLFIFGTVTLVWSLVVVASCVSIAALLILLDKNKRFRQELARRLHI